ncbi:MAG: hypothetical protein SV253_07910 [Halobacteria archaeon]|nr:hypothetical protein [Halobacteria archaeon]
MATKNVSQWGEVSTENVVLPVGVYLGAVVYSLVSVGTSMTPTPGMFVAELLKFGLIGTAGLAVSNYCTCFSRCPCGVVERAVRNTKVYAAIGAVLGVLLVAV